MITLVPLPDAGGETPEQIGGYQPCRGALHIRGSYASKRSGVCSEWSALSTLVSLAHF
jgi:hypothetical protein